LQNGAGLVSTLRFTRCTTPLFWQLHHAKGQSWPRKSAQDDKWSFCLTAGTL
jgi:hypothetical protein